LQENLSQQEQENQEQENLSQPDGLYDPSGLGITLSEEESTEEAAQEEEPSTEEEAPAETETPTTEEVVTETVEDLKAKLQEMEAKLNEAPVVQSSQALYDKVLDPAFFKSIVDLQTKSPLEVMMEVARRDNPWVESDEDALFALSQRFGDIDTEIPENLGLSGPQFKQFQYEAEGQRTNLIERAREEMKKELETIAPSAQAGTQQEALSVEEFFTNTVNPFIEKELAAFKLPDVSGIEGYALKMPTVQDVGKYVRESFHPDKDPIQLDEKGNVLPHVQAIGQKLVLESILQQLGPMAKELMRKVPEITRKAVEQSLSAPPRPAANTPSPRTLGAQRNDGLYDPSKLGISIQG
jgi:hypothetical protein